jgi:hypothetical protein
MKLKLHALSAIIGVCFAIPAYESIAADTSSNQQKGNMSSTQDGADSKAETAVEAFEESDAGPTGSWASGCSPESTTASSPSVDKEDCLPQDTQEK